MSDTLKEQYYINKLSLFIQQDYALVERFKDVFSFLKNYNDTIASVNYAISTILTNIFNGDQEPVDDYTYSDLLDKIAACFNLSRNFDLEYGNNQSAANQFWADVVGSGATPPTHLSLDNEQLRFLIACKIANNSYDGSMSSTNDLYQIFINKFLSKHNAAWHIYVNTTGNGLCTITLDIQTESLSTDIKLQEYIAMFFAEMIILKSLGITYTLKATELNKTLLWSSDDDPNITEWDNNYWL